MAVAVGGVWRRAGTCNVQQFHADVGASSNSMLMLVSSNSMLGPVLWRELVGWSSPQGPVSVLCCKMPTFFKCEHELASCASFAMEGGTGGNVNVGL